MSVTIDKFVTRCRVSNERRNLADIADRVARERMGSALAHHLGPSLSRLPAVVRIRRIRLRLRMAAGRVNEAALTQAWAEAFGRELFNALAWPSGSGVIEILRYASQAEFHAAFIRDLLSGEAERCWQYEEFQPYFARRVPEALIMLLAESAAPAADTLAALDEIGSLELTISRLDDLAIERLFRAIGDTPQYVHDVTIQEIVQIARLAAVRHIRAPLDSRAQALYQFVRETKAGLAIAPRTVFQVLLALAFIGRNPSHELGHDEPDSIPVQQIIRRIRDLARSDSSEPLLAELSSSIDELKPLIPGAAKPAVSPVLTIDSDFAGLFLLAPLITRSHELADIRDSKYLMAALALSVLGRFDADVRRLDPGVALFAGFTAEPDLVGMRRYLAAQDNCRTRLEKAADQLLLDLAARVRGFRDAPPSAIVRQFIAKPGRVEMNDDSLHVYLAPSPYHVALHIAGMDGETMDLDWLGGRRLHIHLEGL